MNGRQVVAAVAVLFVVLATAGCREGAKDQAVIDRLVKVDIVSVPAGATKISSTPRKGGGSDIVAIRGASTILVVYASPLPPARVAEFYHQTYDKGWTLKDNRAAPVGAWYLGGANRSDSQMIASVEVRPASVTAKVPAGTQSVVSVTVSATRQ